MNTIPQYHTLMLPLLQVMGTGREMTTKQIRDAVADHLGLNAKALAQRLPSGTQTAFDNRMGWARTYLFKAGLIDRPRRATYLISQSGKELLLNPPASIDADFLSSYEKFNEFISATRGEKEAPARSRVNEDAAMSSVLGKSSSRCGSNPNLRGKRIHGDCLLPPLCPFEVGKGDHLCQREADNFCHREYHRRSTFF